MKYCIDQPGCLGDILFTLKIGEVLSEKGEVDWFVNPSFWESGISRLKTSFNLSPNAPRYVEGAEKISLCNLTDRPDPDLMLKKYAVVDMDWSDWSSYVKYDREKRLSSFAWISQFKYDVNSILCYWFMDFHSQRTEV